MRIPLVRGLRHFTMGGPVTVRDAETLKVKYVIHDPPTYDEILGMPGATRKRVHTKAKIKSR